ncbi:hypothetical protein [Lentzea californiensis]|uniref:hypothetical protein n=1 Tax=Lentzea californiensis TaxID=438851 RepID=UPI0021665FAA|nr:hypothetical protein [Lentzea californiensis]MCR3752276.1 hypothetical protein [Lentzea californiensis]
MLHHLEPRTDVPAKDDWSTRLALVDVRVSTRHRVETLSAAMTFAATFFLPDSPGNTAARVVMGVVAAMSLAGWLPNRGVRRALRRGLFDEPWRRASAVVAEKQEIDPVDRLLFDGLVLRGAFDDLPEVVLERQEVFVLGPDAEGRALVRAAGSTSMYLASTEEGEYQPAERVERVLGRPAGEKRIYGGIGLMRGLRHMLWVFPLLTLVTVTALTALSLSPLAPAGLVASALLVPGLFFFPSRSSGSARTGTTPGPWPVPRSGPRCRSGCSPGSAGTTSPGSRSCPAAVRFPRPNADLVANVAGAGVMWVAGTHEGRLTVGLPGHGGLMTAVVRPMGTSDPMSWWRRAWQYDFSALPR